MSDHAANAPERAAVTAEQLIAMFTLDAPIPVRLLYGLYGSRTTFHKWKGMGLEIRTVDGIGPTVRPSSFKTFLLRLRGDATPAVPPESTKARARRASIK